MEEKIAFGKFINQKRKEAGLTQRELAESLYVTESAVSKWERGISYPDITVVASVCEVLHVTEHELITASDDTRQKEIERQAETYQKMTKGYSVTMYALYGLSLIICFICNLAVDHTVSWFFVVFAAEAVAFSFTSIPSLVSRHKWFWVLVSFYLSLNFLLLVCRVLYGGNWLIIAVLAVALGFAVVFLPVLLSHVFLSLRIRSVISRHKALICYTADTVLLFALVTAAGIQYGLAGRLYTMAYPVVLACIAFPWFLMLVIRYCPVNGYFKTSICLFGTGTFNFFINGILNALIDGKVNIIQPVNLYNWKSDAFINGNITFIITLICLVLAVMFAAGGIACSLRIKREKGEKIKDEHEG